MDFTWRGFALGLKILGNVYIFGLILVIIFSNQDQNWCNHKQVCFSDILRDGKFDQDCCLMIIYSPYSFIWMKQGKMNIFWTCYCNEFLWSRSYLMQAMEFTSETFLEIENLNNIKVRWLLFTNIFHWLVIQFMLQSDRLRIQNWPWHGIGMAWIWHQVDLNKAWIWLGVDLTRWGLDLAFGLRLKHFVICIKTRKKGSFSDLFLWSIFLIKIRTDAS